MAPWLKNVGGGGYIRNGLMSLFTGAPMSPRITGTCPRQIMTRYFDLHDLVGFAISAGHQASLLAFLVVLVRNLRFHA